jgi:CHAD domain-containing protein
MEFRTRDEQSLFYALRTLHAHLRSIKKEIPGVRKGNDVESVHKMRVACRRLLTALEVFADLLPSKSVETWRKSVRRILCALRQARDADIQVDFLLHLSAELRSPKERPGIARLILRIKQKREKKQARIIDVLRGWKRRSALNELRLFLSRMAKHTALDDRVLSPAFHRRATVALREKLNAFLAYEQHVPFPKRIKEFHGMRIAAKRLRYTLETFLPAYGKDMAKSLEVIERIQHLLGEMHDCNVWFSYLQRFIGKEKKRTKKYYGHLRTFPFLLPGIRAVEQNRRKEYERL